MTEIKELNPDELESVTGGKTAAIHTGTSDNAAIRKSPGTGAIIASLKNGELVNTVGTPVYDPASDRNWIMVEFRKKNRLMNGWVAASIVGLKRK